jgi:hypothetical protein
MLCANAPGDLITARLHDGSEITGEYIGGNVIGATLLAADGAAFHLAEADVAAWTAETNPAPSTAAVRVAAISALMLADMQARAAAKATVVAAPDALPITNPDAPPAPTGNAALTAAVKTHLRTAGVTNYTVRSDGQTVVTLGAGAGTSMDDVVAAVADLPWAAFTIRVCRYQHTVTITPAAPPQPLVIIPCGGAKLPHAAPAGELYTGGYHRAARRAADVLAGPAGRVLILSAKWGLLELGDPVAPYEQHMSKPGAIAVDTVRAQARELGIADATDVTVIAGKAYADVVTAVWPHAARPLDGTHGMGEQLARMKALAEPLPLGQLALFPATGEQVAA